MIWKMLYSMFFQENSAIRLNDLPLCGKYNQRGCRNDLKSDLIRKRRIVKPCQKPEREAKETDTAD